MAPWLGYLDVGDGKRQLRALARLAPVELGVDDQETVAVLGYGRRAGEGRVRETLADLTAREVLRELDQYGRG